MVVVAVGGGAHEHPHLRHRRKLRLDLGDPIEGGPARDLAVLVQESAAELALLVGEDDTGAGASGRERGGEAGRSRPDHQHIAVRVEFLVAVGIGFARGRAEAGHPADEVLVAHPRRARPHEGLVVETGRDQAGDPAGPGAEVEADAGPAVLRGRAQAVVEFDLGGAGVGLGIGAGLELDDRVGLVRAGRHHAARAVVLEAAADQPDAVGQEGRRQGVPSDAGVGTAVIGEIERPAPIDAAAAGQAKGLRGSSRDRSQLKPSGDFSPIL